MLSWPGGSEYITKKCFNQPYGWGDVAIPKQSYNSAMSQLNELIAAYIDDLSTRNKHTRKMMARAVRLIPEFEVKLDNNILANIYRKTSDSQKYKSRTKDYFIVCIRQFLKWLDANDKLPYELSLTKADTKYRAVRGHERRNYHPKVFDPRIERLRTYFDEQPTPNTPIRKQDMLRNRAIMHLMFSTACRAAEVLSIDRADIADGAITEPAVIGKGNKSRIIFLDEPTINAIKAYLDTRTDKCPALFIRHRFQKEVRLSTMQLWNIVKTAAKACNLSPNTSPHMIRHFVATDMMNNHDTPLEVVQKILGHASPTTTETVYAHSRMKQIKRHITRYRDEKQKSAEPQQPNADTTTMHLFVSEKNSYTAPFT
jgi:integrase/recombinase XerD